jgi:hypothetical protein
LSWRRDNSYQVDKKWVIDESTSVSHGKCECGHIIIEQDQARHWIDTDSISLGVSNIHSSLANTDIAGAHHWWNTGLCNPVHL